MLLLSFSLYGQWCCFVQYYYSVLSVTEVTAFLCILMLLIVKYLHLHSELQHSNLLNDHFRVTDITKCWFLYIHLVSQTAYTHRNTAFQQRPGLASQFLCIANQYWILNVSWCFVPNNWSSRWNRSYTNYSSYSFSVNFNFQIHLNVNANASL